MIMHTFHPRPSFHFTLLHITPHFSLPCTFERFASTLQKPFTFPNLQLIYFLSKNIWFTGESCLRPFRELILRFDYRIYRDVFVDSSSLFADPNFTIVIIPAQVAWSFWPPLPHRFPCRFSCVCFEQDEIASQVFSRTNCSYGLQI